MHFYTVVILYRHIILSFKLVRAVICAAVFGPFHSTSHMFALLANALKPISGASNDHTEMNIFEPCLRNGRA